MWSCRSLGFLDGRAILVSQGAVTPIDAVVSAATGSQCGHRVTEVLKAVLGHGSQRFQR